MKTGYGIIFVFCLAAFSLFIAGCQPHTGGGNSGPELSKNASSSQKGIYNARSARAGERAGNTDDDFDPVKLHMMARNAVDPDHPHKRNRYTRNVKDVSRKKARGPGLYAGTTSVQAGGGDLRYALVNGVRVPFPPQKPGAKRASVQAAVATKGTGTIVKPAVKPKGGGALSSTVARALPTPNVKPYSAAILAVRKGEHKGKTRLVLDVSDKTDFITRLENGGKTLLVRLPKARWAAQDSMVFERHPLLLSLRSGRDSQGGTWARFLLKRPGRVMSKMILRPNATYDNHRIVLDLAAL